MDTTGFRGAHRAEHLSRQAAAEARASYYAHPKLHFHTYAGQGAPIADPDRQDGQGVSPLNQPANAEQRAAAEAAAAKELESGAALTTNELAEKTGANKGTKEELGGKVETAPPSALDEGALELGGEAGGTHSSPGPTAEVVAAAKQAATSQAGGMSVDGAVQLPNDRAPGTREHWSAATAMEPHLQLMCGPLINYYTTRDNVWHGAALVVTADNGSVFNPAPVLSLNFFPYVPQASGQPPATQPIMPPQEIPAQRILTYNDPTTGPCSFWRFAIKVPLQDTEVSVRYRLNRGAEIGFVVPKINQNFRWISHSCNGFSSGVNPDDFKGKTGKFTSGYDPMWEDALGYHYELAYHCMVGGGDQIYCDAITREPELQSWVNAPSRTAKINCPLTDEMRIAIDRFYFNHYCKIFRSNAFGRANSTIPMVNMLDDHDIIDGFGTYDDETMASPVMSHVGSRGYFWFLIFQLFIHDEIDGLDHAYGAHPLAPSLLVGNKPGPWIPYHSHSLGVYLGPKVFLVALDCRAERKLTEVVRPDTYERVFSEIVAPLPAEVEHLVMLLGVPIAYPRMSFLEHFLESKYNPLVVFARHNMFGLGGMVNKFNQSAELLDDLNDHWCANTHKKERNWLVLRMQDIAQKQGLRVTFLSGDVHLAAVGCLFTYSKSKRRIPAPTNDHRYMLNVITSAIVNTPPPAGAAMMVGLLAGNKHRTLHRKHTDEKVLPIFAKDTDGSTQKRPYVLARRNYAQVVFNESTADLNFEFRVEKSPGAGETVPYTVDAPPPRYGESHHHHLGVFRHRDKPVSPTTSAAGAGAAGAAGAAAAGAGAAGVAGKPHAGAPGAANGSVPAHGVADGTPGHASGHRVGALNADPNRGTPAGAHAPAANNAVPAAHASTPAGAQMPYVPGQQPPQQFSPQQSGMAEGVPQHATGQQAMGQQAMGQQQFSPQQQGMAHDMPQQQHAAQQQFSPQQSGMAQQPMGQQAMGQQTMGQQAMGQQQFTPQQQHAAQQQFSPQQSGMAHDMPQQQHTAQQQFSPQQSGMAQQPIPQGMPQPIRQAAQMAPGSHQPQPLQQ